MQSAVVVAVPELLKDFVVVMVVAVADVEAKIVPPYNF